MSFSIYTYAFPGLIIPGLLLLFLFISAFALSKLFSQKKNPATIIVFPLVCVLVIFLFFLVRFSYGYIYPLSAIFQHNSNRYITIGYIDDITDAPAPPLYYNSVSQTWCSGKLLTVDGNQYYIPFGDVKAGDAVELIWGNNERVVYKYSLNDSISQEEIGTQPVLSNTAEKPESSFKEAGRMISTAAFVAFAICVFLQYPVGKVLSNFLVKRDMETIQRIIPNKIGLVIFVLLSLPLLGIVFGMVLTGFEEILLITSLVLCVWIVWIIKKLNTELIIKQDVIVIKECKSIKTFSKQDVLDVRFCASRLPYNRCLVITFQNGQKVVFDQTDFWGLNSVYLALAGQGDGLRQ